jgi:hypothetical protein
MSIWFVSDSDAYEGVLKALKCETDSEFLDLYSEELNKPVVGFFKNLETGERYVIGCKDIHEFEKEYTREYHDLIENGLELIRLFVNGKEIEFSTQIKIIIKGEDLVWRNY